MLIIPTAFLLVGALSILLLVVGGLLLLRFFDTLFYIILVVVFVFPFSFLQYLSEGHAELYAISKIGTENYLSAIEEFKNKKPRKPTLLEELQKKLSYPDEKFMVRLYNFLKTKN